MNRTGVMYLWHLQNFRIFGPPCLHFHATSPTRLPYCICFWGTRPPPCADIICTHAPLCFAANLEWAGWPDAAWPVPEVDGVLVEEGAAVLLLIAIHSVEGCLWEARWLFSDWRMAVWIGEMEPFPMKWLNFETLEVSILFVAREGPSSSLRDSHDRRSIIYFCPQPIDLRLAVAELLLG